MSRTWLAAALVLAACHRPETKVVEETAAPAPIVKYRGSAVSGNGLHLDLSISADGSYTVYFMDPSGDDLPAAQLKDVAVDRVGLNINDTGETWIGKGALPTADGAKLGVSFSFLGKNDSASVALNPVNAPLDYVCPMDPDVRSATPGVCSRCGMKLVAGIPEPEEWPLNMELAPARPRAGEKVQLIFSVEHPDTGKPATKFEIVHERLFHLFIVSSDLKYFVHDHPAFDGAGKFRYSAVFPKPGMYRVLGDFYPSGGTPQLAPKTLFVAGGASLDETKLAPDLATQKGRTTAVDLVLDPPHPTAGTATHLTFALKPDDGLEKFLGTWAHMLAASDDVIDLLHEHPYDAQNGKIEFDMTFPRARTYRVWVQFQRRGMVNTVAFNVPVQAAQP
jgi:Heavy metal binding domain